MLNNLIDFILDIAFISLSFGMAGFAVGKQDYIFSTVFSLLGLVYLILTISSGYKKAEKYKRRFNSAVEDLSELRDYKKVLEALDHEVVDVEFKIRDKDTVVMEEKSDD